MVLNFHRVHKAYEGWEEGGGEGMEWGGGQVDIPSDTYLERYCVCFIIMVCVL